MLTMKRWLVKLGLFVGIILLAAVVGEALNIHLGDDGYMPLLLGAVVTYYILRNIVLRKLNLLPPPKV